MTAFRRLASVKSCADLRAYLAELKLDLPFDETVESGPAAPLAQPCMTRQGTIGNRFAILPMEGWDGTLDGRPTERTLRRWQRFGQSGAKLIWGGEAVAVRPDGRANPNQLLLSTETLPDLARLREALEASHRQHFGRTDDLRIGLQLTHSGRFSRPGPTGKPEPRILYRHPDLDARFAGADERALLTDDEIARLVDDFVLAARRARQAGFHFVDIKHCHGYLGHEFLSAFDRPGRYGGSLENRTRFLREVVAGMRAESPGLEPAVRVSVFDFLPFRPGPAGQGEPVHAGPYAHAFGGDGTGLGINLSEPSQLLDMLAKLDIELVCVSAGSPYYNPHLMRPAQYPPSDGYHPPEDPLVGVARLIQVAAQLRARHPSCIIVGSGYSYLQQWLPHVAQRVVRESRADFVGLGRMVLSYPELPADVLAGRPLTHRLLCRTFSDCTTAPRNGLPSGCYPLDPAYRDSPERLQVARIKRGLP